MLTALDKENARMMIKQNQHEVYILSLEEMDCVIEKGVKGKLIKDEWKKLKGKVEVSASYFATGQDVVLLGKLMGDLGFAGTKTYIKYYGGKAHFILKGYPGLRSILNGTRYGIQNAKVIQMGLGKYGAIQAAKGGGILTIVLVSTYRVIDYFLTDSATLNQLIGTLAVDVVKVGMVTGASILAASSVASLTVSTGILIAFGPLAAAIVIGIGVTMLLEIVDERYNITEKVVAALDEISKKGIIGIIEEKKQAIYNKGKDLANDVIGSVIDYAVARIEESLKNVIDDLFRRLPLPKI